MIIDKRDPWLRTHWPPWEFGCNCDLENCSAKKAATLGTVKPMSDPEDVKVESESGFAFDPAHAFGEFDLSLIKDAGDRARAAEGLQREFACKISEDGLVASTPKEDETQKLQFVDRRPGPKVQKAVKALEASVERVDFYGMPEDAAPLVREASEQIARRAKEYGLHFSYVGTNDHSSTRTPLSPNTVFEALGPDEKTGRMELIFNAGIFADPGQLREGLGRSERNGFHPAGCNTIAAYVDHEISHFLFTIAKMDEDEDFMRTMRQLKAQQDLVRESISSYAVRYTVKDDVSFAQEVLAECFMSVKQRPFFPPKKHKEIVKMLENRLKRSILKQKEKK
ncbi:MAG: hypothetical protein IJT50_09270 [Lentisphaeria bacterium]|nr:hypothetical protein [Lentisphaeria bacterium]